MKNWVEFAFIIIAFVEVVLGALALGAFIAERL
jgi:hypothetical protein